MSSNDPTDTASAEAARSERVGKVRLAEQVEVEDTKWMMSSKRGRRIQHRLLDKAGIFRSSFNTNSMTMAFQEGCKNEGLRVLALIHEAAPDMYAVMLKEAKE